MVLNRVLDTALGMTTVLSLKYLAKAIGEVYTIGDRVDEKLVTVIVGRLQSLHLRFLKDPCYFEMNTEERWVVVLPYFDQLVQYATKTIPAKRYDGCRNKAHKAVTQLIHSKGI